MNRNRAAAAGAIIALAAVAALSLRAGIAGSQTPTGHEAHSRSPAATGKAAASRTALSKATTPKPTGDGKTVSLPGVPPGTLAVGDGVTTTITGEVMDPACFLEAGEKSVSQGHYQCAIDCARSGQTLAIYNRDIDRIYFVAGELPGRNPNAPLLPYIHKKVDVLGTVYHRSQAWGIVIVKVTPHKPKSAAASAPSVPAAGAK